MSGMRPALFATPIAPRLDKGIFDAVAEMAKAMKLHRLGFLLGEAGGEVVDLAYGEFLKAQVETLR